MATKKSRSTDDYDPQKFRPFGRVTFTVDDDILLCEAQGPFTRELIAAIADIQLSLIQEMQQFEKWGRIVIIKDSAMASPESLEALTEYLSTLGRANLLSVITTMVIDDTVEGAQLMTSQFMNAFADAALNLTVFKTVNDAKVFVKLHL
ncbi:hypothetical protein AAKU58_000174 [Oxalobacteraceae bacterium GrIS 1.18]